MNDLFKSERLVSTISNPENQRTIRKVFGEFITEGDLHVLAGITNSGKSILANDIAVMAAGGPTFWGETICEIEGTSLIFDFELSDLQTAARYRKGVDMLPGNIIRAKLSMSGYGASKDELINEIKSLVEIHRPNLVVLDNLTALLGSSSSATEVFDTMTFLKMMKETYDLTIVVVTHLKKQDGRMKKPLTMDCIYGSSAITRFADSVSVLGDDPADGRQKYLKMLKTRGGEFTKEVAVMKITSSPYLHFEFIDWSTEDYFLPIRKDCMNGAITPELGERIIQLHDDGLSLRKIADETGCSKSSVGRFLKAAQEFN